MSEDTLTVTKIGWFNDVVHTNPQGYRMQADLFNKLLDIGKKHLVRRTMGCHICRVCFEDEGQFHELDPNERNQYPDFRYWGNGEIWIKGKKRLWVAPTLIVHYIRDHGFLPSKEFLDDLRALTEDEAAFFSDFEKKDNKKFVEIYGKV